MRTRNPKALLSQSAASGTPGRQVPGSPSTLARNGSRSRRFLRLERISRLMFNPGSGGIGEPERRGPRHRPHALTRRGPRHFPPQLQRLGSRGLCGSPVAGHAPFCAVANPLARIGDAQDNPLKPAAHGRRAAVSSHIAFSAQSPNRLRGLATRRSFLPAVFEFARANPKTRKPLKPAAVAAGPRLKPRRVVPLRGVRDAKILLARSLRARSREPEGAKTPEAGRCRGRSAAQATSRGAPTRRRGAQRARASSPGARAPTPRSDARALG
jgi:hypothetical protein